MKFLYNSPAILHKSALIIGDTHFGIEEKLKRKGMFVSGISEELAKKIKKLLRITKARKLVILGDVKDKIGICDNITKKIFADLRKLKIEIVIVRGNHDGGIEELNLKTISGKGFIYEGLALVHGHSWPSGECMNARYLISAHQHPMLERTDSTGKVYSAPVVVTMPADEKNILKFYKRFNRKIKLILLPAFNSLVGTKLKRDSDMHFGPLLKNKLFKYNDAKIYSLSGVYLGKMQGLK